MKRKIKLKQVIILLLLVFMCVFALSNYKNYKLLKNGYSINEVKEINKNLISDDIKYLIKTEIINGQHMKRNMVMLKCYN